MSEAKKETAAKKETEAKTAAKKNDGDTLKSALDAETEAKEAQVKADEAKVEAAKAKAAETGVTSKNDETPAGEDVLADTLGTVNATQSTVTEFGNGNPGQLAMEVAVKEERGDGAPKEDADAPTAKAAKGMVTVTALQNFSHGVKDKPSIRMQAGQTQQVEKEVAEELKQLGKVK